MWLKRIELADGYQGQKSCLNLGDIPSGFYIIIIITVRANTEIVLLMHWSMHFPYVDSLILITNRCLEVETTIILIFQWWYKKVSLLF